MAETKMAVIHDVEERLIGKMTAEQIEAVTDALTAALAKYDVVKACTDLVPYDDVNERILKRYCACLFVDGKSQKTIAQYRRTCVKLAEASGRPFTEMGAYDIRYFLACEKERGISGRTLENTRANLSAFFQWMAREDMIPKNPCLNIKPIKYTDKVRLPLSDVDIDALRAACANKKERAVIELLLSTGVRVSELSEMKVEDIDQASMSVHVRHGKGDKERVTYTTNVAMKHVKEYWKDRKPSEYVIPNQRGERIGPGGIREMLKRIAARAGVENVHPHRFRRTFASGLAARGMDVQEIRKLLGHTNINTTMEYVHTSDEKVSAAYRQYIA